MSNLTRLQAVSSSLDTAIATAENLPEAGGGGGSIETCTVQLSYGYSAATTDGIISGVAYTGYENNQITPMSRIVNATGTVTINNVVKNTALSMYVLGGCNNVITDYDLLYPGGSGGLSAAITKDGSLHCYPCFLKNTKIHLFNNSVKSVQDITYDDELLVWDFDNGCYASAKPIWIKKVEIATEYYHCQFEDNITLDLVGGRGHAHRIFCLDTNRFEYANDCVGKTIMTKDGPKCLISCDLINKEVEFYNIITDYHMNLFANNILSSTGFNNLYKVENMKFIKESRELIPIEAFKNCPEEYYYGLRLGEQVDYSMERLNEKIEMLVEKACPNRD